MNIPLKVTDIIGTKDRVVKANEDLAKLTWKPEIIQTKDGRILKFRYKSFSTFVENGGKTTTEIRLSAKQLLCLLGGTSDYQTWNLPLESNVRRPSENNVVKSIINNLKNTSTEYTFPTPIYMSCTNVWQEGTYLCILLTDRDGIPDGILDGGHRILGIKLADERDVDLSNVYICLRIFTGFSSQEITQTAIALNTSKHVRHTSINNYFNLYEPIKILLKDQTISFFEGDPSAPKDVYCSVSRIISLLKCLDTDYHPRNQSQGRNEKRHPITSLSMVGNFDRLPPFLEKYKHLLKSAVDLQNEIALELDKRYVKACQSGENIPYVTSPRNKKYTQIPSGATLSCKLPAAIYIFPIVSAFKVFLDKENKWTINFEKLHKRIVRKLVTKMIEILRHSKYQGLAENTNVRNPKIWDMVWDEATKMYNLM